MQNVIGSGNVIMGMHFTPMAPELTLYRVLDLATAIIFYIRWIVIPIYQTGSLSTLLHVRNSSLEI
jgi:hypothetical protein